MNELQQEYYDKVNTCPYVRDMWCMSASKKKGEPDLGFHKLNEAFTYLLTPELIEHFCPTAPLTRPSMVKRDIAGHSKVSLGNEHVCYRGVGSRTLVWCMPLALTTIKKANPSLKITREVMSQYKMGTLTSLPVKLAKDDQTTTIAASLETTVPAISREEYIRNFKAFILEGEIPSFWFYGDKLNATLISKVEALGYPVIVRGTPSKTNKVSEPITLPQSIVDEARGLLPVISWYYEITTGKPLYSSIPVQPVSDPLWPNPMDKTTHQLYSFISSKVFDSYKEEPNKLTHAAIYLGWKITEHVEPDGSEFLHLVPRTEVKKVLNDPSCSTRDVPVRMITPEWDEPTQAVLDFLQLGLQDRHYKEATKLNILIMLEIYKVTGLIVDVRAVKKK